LAMSPSVGGMCSLLAEVVTTTFLNRESRA
jgi:hypothetical protein